MSYIGYIVRRPWSDGSGRVFLVVREGTKDRIPTISGPVLHHEGDREHQQPPPGGSVWCYKPHAEVIREATREDILQATILKGRYAALHHAEIIERHKEQGTLDRRQKRTENRKYRHVVSRMDEVLALLENPIKLPDYAIHRPKEEGGEA